MLGSDIGHEKESSKLQALLVPAGVRMLDAVSGRSDCPKVRADLRQHQLHLALWQTNSGHLPAAPGSSCHRGGLRSSRGSRACMDPAPSACTQQSSLLALHRQVLLIVYATHTPLTQPSSSFPVENGD